MTEAPEPDAPPEPEVFEHHTTDQGDWRLVRFGSWEISVGPDGCLRLPHLLHPRDWNEFIAAGAKAVEVGGPIAEAYQAALAAADKTPHRGRAVVTPRGTAPPAGTTPMLVTPGPNQPRSAIGRPRTPPRRRRG